MTIKMVADFYFTHFETLEVSSRYEHGDYGKWYTYTKDAFETAYAGYLDNEVTGTEFHGGDAPRLFFVYR